MNHREIMSVVVNMSINYNHSLLGYAMRMPLRRKFLVISYSKSSLYRQLNPKPSTE